MSQEEKIPQPLQIAEALANQIQKDRSVRDQILQESIDLLEELKEQMEQEEIVLLNKKIFEDEDAFDEKNSIYLNLLHETKTKTFNAIDALLGAKKAWGDAQDNALPEITLLECVTAFTAMDGLQKAVKRVTDKQIPMLESEDPA